MTKRRSSEVIATRGSVKPAALLASFVAGPNAGPPACATAGATTKTATRHATARMRPPRTSGQRLRYKKLARRAVLSPGAVTGGSREGALMSRNGLGLAAFIASAAVSLAVTATAGAGTMTFRASTVAPADGGGTSVVQDLYEPKITAAPGGPGKPPVLYVTGHAIGAYTTRAPAFVSNDLGATWASMPGVAPGAVPGGGHVGGDEGIIVGDP